MENNSLIGVMTAALVTVLLLGMCLVPFVNDIAYTTTTIENEGAGELRYAYYDEPAGYYKSAVYESETDTITATDISGITPGDLIFWASDVGSVIFSEGKFTLFYDNEGTMTAVDLGEGFAVHGSDYGEYGEVSILSYNIADPISFDEVAWAYVIDGDGNFGNFTEGGATIKDFPVAAIGVFAGVECANDFSSAYDLVMTETVTDGVFEDATWSQE